MNKYVPLSTISTDLETLSRREKEREDAGAESEVMTEHAVRHTFNFYASNKTVAQGLLDLALLTTNAMQLKHVILIGDLHPFYDYLFYGIVLSIFLQICLGILLLILGSRDLTNHQVQTLDNYVAALIFVITIVNVIVSIFNDETVSRKYRSCLKRAVSTSKDNETFYWED